MIPFILSCLVVLILHSVSATNYANYTSTLPYDIAIPYQCYNLSVCEITNVTIPIDATLEHGNVTYITITVNVTSASDIYANETSIYNYTDTCVNSTYYIPLEVNCSDVYYIKVVIKDQDMIILGAKNFYVSSNNEGYCSESSTSYVSRTTPHIDNHSEIDEGNSSHVFRDTFSMEFSGYIYGKEGSNIMQSFPYAGIFAELYKNGDCTSANYVKGVDLGHADANGIMYTIKSFSTSYTITRAVYRIILDEEDSWYFTTGPDVTSLSTWYNYCTDLNYNQCQSVTSNGNTGQALFNCLAQSADMSYIIAGWTTSYVAGSVLNSVWPSHPVYNVWYAAPHDGMDTGHDTILLDDIRAKTPSYIGYTIAKWVMYKFNGNKKLSTWQTIPNICTENNRNGEDHWGYLAYAFAEGYAIAFGLMMTSEAPNGGHVFYNLQDSTPWDIEHYPCSLNDPIYDSGAIAAFLLDLVDSSDDSGSGVSNACDSNNGYEYPMNKVFYDFSVGAGDVERFWENMKVATIADYQNSRGNIMLSLVNYIYIYDRMDKLIVVMTNTQISCPDTQDVSYTLAGNMGNYVCDETSSSIVVTDIINYVIMIGVDNNGTCYGPHRYAIYTYLGGYSTTMLYTPLPNMQLTIEYDSVNDVVWFMNGIYGLLGFPLLYTV